MRAFYSTLLPLLPFRRQSTVACVCVCTTVYVPNGLSLYGRTITDAQSLFLPLFTDENGDAMSVPWKSEQREGERERERESAIILRSVLECVASYSRPQVAGNWRDCEWSEKSLLTSLFHPLLPFSFSFSLLSFRYSHLYLC